MTGKKVGIFLMEAHKMTFKKQKTWSFLKTTKAVPVANNYNRMICRELSRNSVLMA